MNCSVTDGPLTAPPYRDVVVKNELGLHARPAAMIAKLAAQAQGPVWLLRGDTQADAASTLDILTLGCPPGTALRVAIENPRDQELLDALARLFEKGFKD